MRHYLFFSITLTILFFSCKSDHKQIDHSQDNKGISVEITNSAGAYLSNETFVALPFNTASHLGIEYVILSKSIAKGQSIQIKPIGMAKIMEDSIQKNFVLAVPVKEGLSNFKSESFNDFSTKYSSTLWMVEHYLVNRNGTLNSNQFLSWYDENHAKNYLLTETKNTKN